MATYNRLVATLTCPRCNSAAEVDVACYFGYTGPMKSYRLGDVYDWLPRKAIQNGGRPEEGHAKGEGYGECPTCARDFFIVVHVVADQIVKVEPDVTRAPYMPDQYRDDVRLTCPICRRTSVSEVHLYEGYSFGRVLPDCGCRGEVYVALDTSFRPDVEVDLGPASPTYAFETDVVRNKS